MAENGALVAFMVFISLALVGVMAMIGYLVWASKQPAGWSTKVKQFLNKPFFGNKPDKSPSPIKLNPRSGPCQYANGNVLEQCIDADYSAASGVLTAKCLANDGQYHATVLDVNNCVNCGVTSVNGVLGCSQGTKDGLCSSYGGNWLDECDVDFNPQTGAIVTKCPNRNGDLVQSSFQLSQCNTTTGCNINNVNGALLCMR